MITNMEEAAFSNPRLFADGVNDNPSASVEVLILQDVDTLRSLLSYKRQQILKLEEDLDHLKVINYRLRYRSESLRLQHEKLQCEVKANLEVLAVKLKDNNVYLQELLNEHDTLDSLSNNNVILEYIQELQNGDQKYLPDSKNVSPSQSTERSSETNTVQRNSLTPAMKTEIGLRNKSSVNLNSMDKSPKESNLDSISNQGQENCSKSFLNQKRENSLCSNETHRGSQKLMTSVEERTSSSKKVSFCKTVQLFSSPSYDGAKSLDSSSMLHDVNNTGSTVTSILTQPKQGEKLAAPQFDPYSNSGVKSKRSLSLASGQDSIKEKHKAPSRRHSAADNVGAFWKNMRSREPSDNTTKNLEIESKQKGERANHSSFHELSSFPSESNHNLISSVTDSVELFQASGSSKRGKFSLQNHKNRRSADYVADGSKYLLKSDEDNEDSNMDLESLESDSREEDYDFLPKGTKRQYSFRKVRASLENNLKFRSFHDPKHWYSDKVKSGTSEHSVGGIQTSKNSSGIKKTETPAYDFESGNHRDSYNNATIDEINDLSEDYFNIGDDLRFNTTDILSNSSSLDKGSDSAEGPGIVLTSSNCGSESVTNMQHSMGNKGEEQTYLGKSSSSVIDIRKDSWGRSIENTSNSTNRVNRSIDNRSTDSMSSQRVRFKNSPWITSSFSLNTQENCSGGLTPKRSSLLASVLSLQTLKGMDSVPLMHDKTDTCEKINVHAEIPTKSSSVQFAYGPQSQQSNSNRTNERHRSVMNKTNKEGKEITKQEQNNTIRHSKPSMNNRESTNDDTNTESLINDVYKEYERRRSSVPKDDQINSQGKRQSRLASTAMSRTEFENVKVWLEKHLSTSEPGRQLLKELTPAQSTLLGNLISTSSIETDMTSILGEENVDQDNDCKAIDDDEHTISERPLEDTKTESLINDVYKEYERRRSSVPKDDQINSQGKRQSRLASTAMSRTEFENVKVWLEKHLSTSEPGRQLLKELTPAQSTLLGNSISTGSIETDMTSISGEQNVDHGNDSKPIDDDEHTISERPLEDTKIESLINDVYKEYERRRSSVPKDDQINSQGKRQSRLASTAMSRTEFENVKVWLEKHLSTSEPGRQLLKELTPAQSTLLANLFSTGSIETDMTSILGEENVDHGNDCKAIDDDEHTISERPLEDTKIESLINDVYKEYERRRSSIPKDDQINSQGKRQSRLASTAMSRTEFENVKVWLEKHLSTSEPGRQLLKELTPAQSTLLGNLFSTGSIETDMTSIFGEQNVDHGNDSKAIDDDEHTMSERPLEDTKIESLINDVYKEYERRRSSVPKDDQINSQGKRQSRLASTAMSRTEFENVKVWLEKHLSTSEPGRQLLKELTPAQSTLLGNLFSTGSIETDMTSILGEENIDQDNNCKAIDDDEHTMSKRPLEDTKTESLINDVYKEYERRRSSVPKDDQINSQGKRQSRLASTAMSRTEFENVKVWLEKHLSTSEPGRQLLKELTPAQSTLLGNLFSTGSIETDMTSILGDENVDQDNDCKAIDDDEHTISERPLEDTKTESLINDVYKEYERRRSSVPKDDQINSQGKRQSRLASTAMSRTEFENVKVWLEKHLSTSEPGRQLLKELTPAQSTLLGNLFSTGSIETDMTSILGDENVDQDNDCKAIDDDEHTISERPLEDTKTESLINDVYKEYERRRSSVPKDDQINSQGKRQSRLASTAMSRTEFENVKVWLEKHLSTSEPGRQLLKELTPAQSTLLGNLFSTGSIETDMTSILGEENVDQDNDCKAIDDDEHTISERPLEDTKTESLINDVYKEYERRRSSVLKDDQINSQGKRQSRLASTAMSRTEFENVKVWLEKHLSTSEPGRQLLKELTPAQSTLLGNLFSTGSIETDMTSILGDENVDQDNDCKAIDDDEHTISERPLEDTKTESLINDVYKEYERRRSSVPKDDQINSQGKRQSRLASTAMSRTEFENVKVWLEKHLSTSEPGRQLLKELTPAQSTLLGNLFSTGSIETDMTSILGDENVDQDNDCKAIDDDEHTISERPLEDTKTESLINDLYKEYERRRSSVPKDDQSNSQGKRQSRLASTAMSRTEFENVKVWLEKHLSTSEPGRQLLKELTPAQSTLLGNLFSTGSIETDMTSILGDENVDQDNDCKAIDDDEHTISERPLEDTKTESLINDVYKEYERRRSSVPKDDQINSQGKRQYRLASTAMSRTEFENVKVWLEKHLSTSEPGRQLLKELTPAQSTLLGNLFSTGSFETDMTSILGEENVDHGNDSKAIDDDEHTIFERPLEDTKTESLINDVYKEYERRRSSVPKDDQINSQGKRQSRLASTAMSRTEFENVKVWLEKHLSTSEPGRQLLKELTPAQSTLLGNLFSTGSIETDMTSILGDENVDQDNDCKAIDDDEHTISERPLEDTKTESLINDVYKEYERRRSSVPKDDQINSQGKRQSRLASTAMSRTEFENVKVWLEKHLSTSEPGRQLLKELTPAQSTLLGNLFSTGSIETDMTSILGDENVDQDNDCKAIDDDEHTISERPLEDTKTESLINDVYKEYERRRSSVPKDDQSNSQGKRQSRLASTAMSRTEFENVKVWLEKHLSTSEPGRQLLKELTPAQSTLLGNLFSTGSIETDMTSILGDENVDQDNDCKAIDDDEHTISERPLEDTKTESLINDVYKEYERRRSSVPKDDQINSQGKRQSRLASTAMSRTEFENVKVWLEKHLSTSEPGRQLLKELTPAQSTLLGNLFSTGSFETDITTILGQENVDQDNDCKAVDDDEHTIFERPLEDTKTESLINDVYKEYERRRSSVPKDDQINSQGKRQSRLASTAMSRTEFENVKVWLEKHLSTSEPGRQLLKELTPAQSTLLGNLFSTGSFETDITTILGQENVGQDNDCKGVDDDEHTIFERPLEDTKTESLINDVYKEYERRRSSIPKDDQINSQGKRQSRLASTAMSRTEFENVKVWLEKHLSTSEPGRQLLKELTPAQSTLLGNLFSTGSIETDMTSILGDENVDQDNDCKAIDDDEHTISERPLEDTKTESLINDVYKEYERRRSSVPKDDQINSQGKRQSRLASTAMSRTEFENVKVWLEKHLSTSEPGRQLLKELTPAQSTLLGSIFCFGGSSWADLSSCSTEKSGSGTLDIDNLCTSPNEVDVTDVEDDYFYDSSSSALTDRCSCPDGNSYSGRNEAKISNVCYEEPLGFQSIEKHVSMEDQIESELTTAGPRDCASSRPGEARKLLVIDRKQSSPQDENLSKMSWKTFRRLSLANPNREHNVTTPCLGTTYESIEPQSSELTLVEPALVENSCTSKTSDKLSPFSIEVESTPKESQLDSLINTSAWTPVPGAKSFKTSRKQPSSEQIQTEDFPSKNIFETQAVKSESNVGDYDYPDNFMIQQESGFIELQRSHLDSQNASPSSTNRSDRVHSWLQKQLSQGVTRDKFLSEISQDYSSIFGDFINAIGKKEDLQSISCDQSTAGKKTDYLPIFSSSEATEGAIRAKDVQSTEVPQVHQDDLEELETQLPSEINKRQALHGTMTPECCDQSSHRSVSSIQVAGLEQQLATTFPSREVPERLETLAGLLDTISSSSNTQNGCQSCCQCSPSIDLIKTKSTLLKNLDESQFYDNSQEGSSVDYHENTLSYNVGTSDCCEKITVSEISFIDDSNVESFSTKGGVDDGSQRVRDEIENLRAGWQDDGRITNGLSISPIPEYAGKLAKECCVLDEELCNKFYPSASSSCNTIKEVVKEDGSVGICYSHRQSRKGYSDSDTFMNLDGQEIHSSLVPHSERNPKIMESSHSISYEYCQGRPQNLRLFPESKDTCDVSPTGKDSTVVSSREALEEDCDNESVICKAAAKELGLSLSHENSLTEQGKELNESIQSKHERSYSANNFSSRSYQDMPKERFENSLSKSSYSAFAEVIEGNRLVKDMIFQCQKRHPSSLETASTRKEMKALKQQLSLLIHHYEDDKTNRITDENASKNPTTTRMQNISGQVTTGIPCQLRTIKHCIAAAKRLAGNEPTMDKQYQRQAYLDSAEEMLNSLETKFDDNIRYQYLSNGRSPASNFRSSIDTWSSISPRRANNSPYSMLREMSDIWKRILASERRFTSQYTSNRPRSYTNNGRGRETSFSRNRRGYDAKRCNRAQNRPLTNKFMMDGLSMDTKGVPGSFKTYSHGIGPSLSMPLWRGDRSRNPLDELATQLNRREYQYCTCHPSLPRRSYKKDYFK